MKKIFKQLKEKRLLNEERDSLRMFLLNYVKDNPVRKEVFFRPQLEKDKKWMISALLKPKLLPALIAMILIIFVGVGISKAAEKSLPGDIFYPVKVKVIENVKSAFIFSKKDKAEFEIERTKRRLKEIEALSNKGKLSVEIIDKTENDLIKHINKTIEISSELKNQNKKQEAINLDSALEKTLLTHKEASNNIAEEIEQERSKIKEKIENLRNKMEIKAKETEEERIKTEDEIKSALNSDRDEDKKNKGEKDDDTNKNEKRKGRGKGNNHDNDKEGNKRN